MISFGEIYDDLITELDKVLESKQDYIEQKKAYIQKKKDELHVFQTSNDIRKQAILNLQLVYEYQSFIYDSAYYYVTKAKQLANLLDDKSLIAEVKSKEGFVLLSSGLFKVAIDSLISVNPKFLSNSLKASYYSTLARAYYDLADYSRDPYYKPKHIAQGNMYLDSAKVYVAQNTNEFWAIESLSRMKQADYSGAKFAFTYWMNNYELPRHYYAIATSSLGYIYILTGYPDQAIENLAKAAIADVKTATMETVALRNLASLLFEKGKDKIAYRFIEEAMNDANFYNARHRQLEISQILPIIERERLNVIRSQRDRIIIFFIFISVLSVSLIVALIIIWKAFRRLNQAQNAIQIANDELREANKIKDEYIADFFNQSSNYIEKIEKLQKWVSRKVAAKQFAGLRKFPENMNVQNERLAMYERFDQIFLKLFPNFVEEFNKLLNSTDQLQLKEGELLNTDLRIYALIRLGINENEKIAHFLNYSVNTIYAYKTKIKGKACCASDQFTQKVMEIKSI
jgi:hypothetical protein